MKIDTKLESTRWGKGRGEAIKREEVNETGRESKQEKGRDKGRTHEASWLAFISTAQKMFSPTLCTREEGPFSCSEALCRQKNSVNLPMTRLDDTMNNTEFTMPDPGVFEIQPEDQRSALLYQQALKSHNEARTLCETLVGFQAQLGDTWAQLLQAGDERLEQNKLLREAMGALRDAASDRHPSLGVAGEVKVNTKQPWVAAPCTFNGDSQ